MKSRKSITKKLFMMTTVVFLIFVSGTLIVQSLFFETFYINKKKNLLQSEIKKFKVNYNKINDAEEFISYINDFEEKTSSKVVILDRYGRLRFTTKSNSQKIDAQKLNIINRIIYQWIDNSNTIDDIKNSNDVMTYITNKINDETRNIICAMPNKEKDEIIFAVSSLQPVNEAGMVIKEFYIYFYIGAVVLIIILSLIISKTISNPLIRMNNTALKMANLDFSEKCKVESEDEIGNLAGTLNFLSENLDEALSSLRQANYKLEEDIIKERNMEKMRKSFVAAVSHELKTPISLIEGYTEGLKDDIFEGEDRNYYLDVILDETRKMSNLVKDMLDLSQLESGNFKLIKEEFFIDELIKSVVRKFSTIFEEKNINIDINLINNIKVNADWTRIEQVITNYITNAIRHCKDKGKIIVNMREEGENIFVEMENDGSSISEDEMVKIWDNFYKIDKSRNRSLGGTGIGLAIVKNIIMLHNGTYGVCNTDCGVKFYFSLKINI